MTPFDELQRAHARLLEDTEAVELAAIAAYIDRARSQSDQIGDPRERDQLRANLRYWASVVYDRSGTYPTTTLLPAAIAKTGPAAPEKVKPVPAPARWSWLIGLGAVVVVVAAIYLSQFALMRPAPAQPSDLATATAVTGNTAAQLRSLPTTTELYDKPGSDPAAQLLGRMQAGSKFYAIARTADGQWLKITTVDQTSGWITTADSGADRDALAQLPEAAIVIAPTSTTTATPPPPPTSAANAGDEPTATVALPTPTRAALRATPTRSSNVGPTPPPPLPPNALPLQVNYQVLTYGPSPFNAEAWVIELQVLAGGGDGYYVYWVNGQRLADQSGRYTVEGVACRSVAVTIGATSNGQAVRREVTLKSPLPACQ